MWTVDHIKSLVSNAKCYLQKKKLITLLKEVIGREVFQSSL